MLHACFAGAAPGGWTSYIVQQGCHVLAVDPADLDATVEAHPNVTHIRLKSQLATASIQQQLQRHGSAAQLLLSDMNTHPVQVRCPEIEAASDDSATQYCVRRASCHQAV